MVGRQADASLEASVIPPVQVINATGQSPFVLACDHASNRIPAPYGTLGLTPHQRLMHIACDPGALAVALRLVDLLDAPLVASTVSRLVIDGDEVGLDGRIVVDRRAAGQRRGQGHEQRGQEAGAVCHGLQGESVQSPTTRHCRKGVGTGRGSPS